MSKLAMMLMLSMALTYQVVDGSSRRRSSKCNGGGGNKCGSDFSEYECGDAKCCHDDFNVWCCPVGPWTCSGTFKSSGGHCSNKQSCKCTDTTYYMTKVEAQSKPSTKYMMAWELYECCDPSSASTCGWAAGTSMSWTKSQTVSWSNTFTASMTVNAKESLLVEGLSESITLTDAYTNGKSKDSTESETIQTPCYGTYTTLTYLNFTAQVAVYTVPVTITYEHCGSSSTTSGTVKSTALIGNYNCEVEACTTGSKTSCSTSEGCVEDRRLGALLV